MSVHLNLYSASRQRGKRVPLSSTLMQLCQTVIVSQIYMANLEVHLIPVKLQILTMVMKILHLPGNTLMQMHPLRITIILKDSPVYATQMTTVPTKL